MTVVPINTADVPRVVEIHQQAFQGQMGTLLGGRYLSHFYTWFTKEPGAICVKIVHDDRVIGFAVGAALGYGARMNRDLFRQAIIASFLHPWIFSHPRFLRTALARFRVLGSSMTGGSAQPASSEGGASLVGIAIDPGFQGIGAGRALLEGFEAEARRIGYEYLRLSVYPSNAAARRLYERAGWTCPNAGDGTLTYEKVISQ